MSSPRKFSEKIALHSQKQEAHTREFEAIMRQSAALKNHIRSAAPEPVTGPMNAVDMSSVLAEHSQLRHSLSGGGGGGGPRVRRHERQNARHAAMFYGGGPARSTSLADRRHTDAAPYHQLQIPAEAAWRRTHSDSSIHATLQHQQQHQLLPQEHQQHQHEQELALMHRGIPTSMEYAPPSFHSQVFPAHLSQSTGSLLQKQFETFSVAQQQQQQQQHQQQQQQHSPRQLQHNHHLIPSHHSPQPVPNIILTGADGAAYSLPHHHSSHPLATHHNHTNSDALQEVLAAAFRPVDNDSLRLLNGEDTP